MSWRESRDDDETVIHLAPSPHAPALARDFLTDFALAYDGVAESCLDAGRLVISELVANAVMHAATPISIHLAVAEDALEVAVGDLSPEPPQLLPADPSRIGGLGLALVNRLAESWGVRNLGRDGKFVWCRLRPQTQAGL